MYAANNYLNTNNFNTAQTVVRRKPYPILVAHDVLDGTRKAELEHDFPHYHEPGYLTYNASDCGPAINSLITELTSHPVADLLGDKLGIKHLSQYPTLVSIASSLNRRHGTIHTDSHFKVATAIVYMNESWPGTSDGCLRFLSRADDINSLLVPEVTPVFGTLAMFRRANNSFHGHLPYEGARREIQIAWIVDEKEKNRKIRRNQLTHFIKGLFGGIDRRLGRNRGANEGHLD